MPNHFAVDRLAGLHERVHNVIGVDDGGPKRSKHLAYD